MHLVENHYATEVAARCCQVRRLDFLIIKNIIIFTILDGKIALTAATAAITFDKSP